MKSRALLAISTCVVVALSVPVVLSEAQLTRLPLPRPISSGLAVQALSLLPAHPDPGQRTVLMAVFANRASETIENLHWELRVNDAVVSSGRRGSLAPRASFEVKAAWRAAAGRTRFEARITAPGVRGGPEMVATRSFDLALEAAKPTGIPAPTTRGGTAREQPAQGPARIAKIELSAGRVVGGESVTATVYLRGPAPAAGAAARVTSSHANIAPVPREVRIAAGAAAVSFDIGTRAVTAPTEVHIAAVVNDVREAVTLTVEPSSAAPTLAGLAPGEAAISTPDAGTATVTISRAAAGAEVVSLVSSDPAIVTVPPTVTISAGQTMAAFPIRGTTDSSEGRATVTATYRGMSRSMQVAVQSGLRVTSLRLSAASVNAGGSVRATVQLRRQAPSGGEEVALSSSQPAGAPVPPRVTVPGGADSATFTITTTSLQVAIDATISATSGGATERTILHITPPVETPLPRLVGLTPDLVAFNSAAEVAGTVTLSGPAPAGGAVVALSSSNPGVVVVPGSVTVTAGQTSAGVTLRAASLTSQGEAQVTAVYGGATRTIRLSVYAAYTVWAVDLASQSAAGGETVRATVRLWGRAPAGGLVVPLATDAPDVAQVPASVTLSAGMQETSFEVKTAAVTAARQSTVCAGNPGTSAACVLGGDFPGGRRLLTVFPGGVPIAELLVSAGAFGPSARVWAGRPVGARVTLVAGAPAGGARIALTSSVPEAVAPPATVELAAGQRELYFEVATRAVTAATVATLTATLGGSTKTAQVEVQPAETLTGLTVAPLEVTGGGVATGTVTLDRAAVAVGAVVTLASDAGVATAPASVTVAPGQTTATFTLATQPVGSPTTVTLTASFAGTTRTATVTLRPPL